MRNGTATITDGMAKLTLGRDPGYLIVNGGQVNVSGVWRASNDDYIEINGGEAYFNGIDITIRPTISEGFNINGGITHVSGRIKSERAIDGNAHVFDLNGGDLIVDGLTCVFENDSGNVFYNNVSVDTVNVYVAGLNTNVVDVLDAKQEVIEVIVTAIDSVFFSVNDSTNTTLYYSTSQASMDAMASAITDSINAGSQDVTASVNGSVITLVFNVAGRPGAISNWYQVTFLSVRRSRYGIVNITGGNIIENEFVK